jgi:hypothetical protein
MLLKKLIVTQFIKIFPIVMMPSESAPQILQNFRCHLQILCARNVTYSKFRAEGLQQTFEPYCYISAQDTSLSTHL